MPEVALRPMTQLEFEHWQQVIARAYAAEKVAAGTWREEEAYDRALSGNAALLPQGLGTPRMLLLEAEVADGTPVGRVWIGLDHPGGAADCAWLYDIEVDPPHRGRGLGRALLDAAERAVQQHGVGALELNVFGPNSRAIGLYASAGYAVVTQQMRKQLRA